MDSQTIHSAVIRQREFFNTGKTLDLKYRITALSKLRIMITQNEEKIANALFKDLHKSHFESYTTEIGLVINEINFCLNHIKKWVKPRKVNTPLYLQPSTSMIHPEPYGVSLIMSPWNYPFMLLMAPLVGAMAAGNCCIIKPAHYSEHTSRIIAELIQHNFPPEYLTVFQGGREVIQALLNEKYEYIFFTGSPQLGQLVMASAAKNLTPVTLELGGKSPCIVDKDVDLKLAARRIAWGKFINAGQTCVCPDYLYIHHAVKDEFIELLKISIQQFYGPEPQQSSDYCRIINDKQFDHLVELIKTGQVIFGGKSDKTSRYIEPTLMDNVKSTAPIMQEEIFGPIFPIMTFNELTEVIEYLKNQPKPLALYFFSNQKSNQKRIITETQSGGVCINNTIEHLANHHLPFGGVGFSGMGQYHGRKSFDTFTHEKPILKKSQLFDFKLKYPPYKNKLKLVKMLLK